MQRVLVIGLDCAAPQLVFERWREDLPNLGGLMRQGSFGRLRSCHPPITVPAWASMLSSRDPGELGLYGFRNRCGYGYDAYRIASSRSVRHPRVWDLLSEAGRKVILLGVPQTYPPRPVNGCMVSCFLTPSTARTCTYPHGLRAEIEGVADGYAFDVEDFRTADKRRLLERIYTTTRAHFRVARHLLTTRPWDFFMMVEMGPDRIHHGFWRYFDPQHRGHVPGTEYEFAVRDYYRYLDDEIGALLSCTESTDLVMVVSDHGAKKMDGGVRFNDWLVRHGYLKLRTVPAAGTRLHPGLVDWGRTLAWADGGYCGRLFLNVRGREPQGIIAPGDYERVRCELAAGIREISAPDGTPLGSAAHRPEELYRQTTGIAPDLLVYFGDLSWRAIGTLGGDDIFSADNDTGPDDANHDWDGILIMRDGERPLDGVPLAQLQLMDVAPTILHHAGVPIPEEMQGSVIDERRRARDILSTIDCRP